MTIYQPQEDSFLLQKTLANFLKNKSPSIKILDMGSGSGIQAEACRKLNFKNLVAVDINKEAVEHLKKSGFNAFQSDLFSNINLQDKFNLIIFNPPYLPEDKREPKDSQQNTTAGKKGNEIIIKFLEQAKSRLDEKGKILLLFSSLSKPKIILKKAKELGYNFNLLDEKSMGFFEKLFVYELR